MGPPGRPAVIKFGRSRWTHIYHSGSWVSDAKRYFSKRNCPAHGLASDYLTGEYIRQEYLETAIKWINGGNIEAYMAEHQHDAKTLALWNYFQSVITWVKATFPNYRRQMKGIPWVEFYDQNKDKVRDAAKLEAQIAARIQDEEVQRPKGIWAYVLDGQERHLNLRAFDDKQKLEAYESMRASAASVASISRSTRWRLTT